MREHNEAEYYNERFTGEEAEDEVEAMLARYADAKAAKTGSRVACAACGTVFTKKSYQQAFCCNRGPANCKDGFWNLVDERRRARAALFA